MDTFFYTFFVFAYMILMIWTFKSSQKELTYRSFLYLIIIGLLYDNLILAVGRFVGTGELLEILNLGRYWIHALVTPTLVLFSYGILKLAEVSWMKHNIVKWLSVIVAIMLSVIEILMVLQLELKPIWDNGVLQYISTSSTNHPPYMIIGVTCVLLIGGFIVYRKTKWKWMLIGTVIMGVGSALSSFLPSGAVTNGFELFLLFTLALTKIHFEKNIVKEYRTHIKNE
ncbi:hypothetical protein [Gracilibacillus kekensis]|uniref:Phospholipid phosphatase n=1 Tax=Gracilibacillus kekensis TaxID=1027249 RepID=A0A1M7Q0U8_9BACI|nr:hypothetical protein [Gracilibacillus kekensis]SHN23777.1 hypothetical protein SAMN05216179_2711 [Gracilibacillus kekensis]